MKLFLGRDQSKLLDDLARSLLVQEHASLRAEILASYAYAQSIVKWTLATFAAIAAAGLVAIANAIGTSVNAILVDVILIIFAFGLPGIIWLNAFTWVGELYRAERAGSYLRAVEAGLSKVKGLSESLGFQPIRWESFIWTNRHVRKSLWGKQTMTYIGTAGTFFGSAIGCIVILIVMIQNLLTMNVLSPGELVWLWIAGSLVANLVCFLFFVLMGRRLFRLGEAVAPLQGKY